MGHEDLRMLGADAWLLHTSPGGLPHSPADTPYLTSVVSTPVLPLSQGEISQIHEDLLTRLLSDPDRSSGPWPDSATSRADYIDRVTRGGFPLALAASSDAGHRRWVDHYLSLTVERDVYELSRCARGTCSARYSPASPVRPHKCSTSRRPPETSDWTRPPPTSRCACWRSCSSRLPAWGRTLTLSPRPPPYCTCWTPASPPGSFDSHPRNYPGPVGPRPSWDTSWKA